MEKNIPRSLSSKLIKEDTSEEIIKKVMLTAKKCKDKGFNNNMIVFCVEKGISPDHKNAQLLNDLVYCYFEEIADALVRGIVSDKEVVKIFKEWETFDYDGDEKAAIINREFKNYLKNRAIVTA
jgi:hypothetical protein